MDKRNAVEMLLADPEWVKWSDREIAKRCVVTNHLVASVRKKLSRNSPRCAKAKAKAKAPAPAESAPKAQPPAPKPETSTTVKFSRGGKEHEMDVTKLRTGRTPEPPGAC